MRNNVSTILVTGGLGFIGSHTVIDLIDRGYKVLIIDSLLNSTKKVFIRLKKLIKENYPQYINNLSFECGDIRDIKFLKNIFINQKYKAEIISGVIHFAGLKSVNDSILEPLDYWDVNVRGTLNLLKVMDLFECRKIVFSSSASIYGESHKKKLKEDDLICPTNPYGTTKTTVENLLLNVFNNKKNLWSICNLRYFNPIGAHKSYLIGENPKIRATNIFPLINKVANGEVEHFMIFGNDWDTPDGTCVRDYIHICDLSNAHLLAIEKLFKKDSGFLTFNVGTGEGKSVLDLINTFEKVNNVEIPYVFTSRREGDVAKVVADNSLIKRELKWQPKYNLEDMCRDGWNWTNLNPFGF